MVQLLAGSGEEELHYSGLHVSLLSAMSASGRILIGLLSDYLLMKHHVRRRTLLAYCIALMDVGMVVALLVTDIEWLWICTVLVGLAYGSIFSISPTLVSERFGTPNFGINWCATVSLYIAVLTWLAWL